MADTRRVIETYFNVSKGVETDADGNTVSDASRMQLYRGTQALCRAHIQTAPNTYFEPPGTATWTFIIDNSFDPDHGDLVVTQNADFNNATDWSELDVTGGKICFPIDTATTALASAFTAASDPALLPGTTGVRGEIWMTVPGVTSILLVQFQVIINNIVGDITSDTALQSFSTSILEHDGQDIVLYFPDGSVAQRWTYE